MSRFSTAAILVVGLGSLQACGGNPSLARFISWNDLEAGDSIRIDGKVRQAKYTANLNTGVVSPGAVEDRDGELEVKLDNAADLKAASVKSVGGSVSFDEDEGDQFDSAGGFIEAETANGEDLGVFADPYAQGFNYQTFGAWMTGNGTGAGIVGVGSFGNVSSFRKGEVPNADSADYAGEAVGAAVDAVGTPYFVASDAAVSVDFVDDNFTFSTTNTVTTNINTLAEAADPSLNLIGSGSLDKASLTGTVDAIADLSGSIDGKLYGPGAPEVGGTYALEGADGQYIGAFGAVQIP